MVDKAKGWGDEKPADAQGETAAPAVEEKPAPEKPVEAQPEAQQGEGGAPAVDAKPADAPAPVEKKNGNGNGLEKRVKQLEKIVQHLLDRAGLKPDDERIG